MMMTGGSAERGGGTRRYECPCRDQMMLLPAAMRDWLPEDHLAWFVIDAVERMDTRGLHDRAGQGPGRRPYLPEMMVALVLYAYCCGIRSSRQIERCCVTDAAFRVICGGLFPDHATIARFVSAHERALGDLFVEGVRLCAAAGLVDLSVVALDGTKIAADASMARNRDARWIRGQIIELMAVTEAAPAPLREDVLGLDAGHKDGAALTGRVGRLKAALAVLDAQQAAAAQSAAHRARAAAAKAEQGHQISGRKPCEPHAALARAEIDYAVTTQRVETMQAAHDAKLAAAQRGVGLTAEPPCRIRRAQDQLARAQADLHAARDAVNNNTATAPRANITDPDSRKMLSKHGWVQGYNAQAIVNHHQIVLACDVSQNSNDVELYEPMTDQLSDTLTRAHVNDQIELVLADAGYWSQANATAPGPDRLIATLKDHKQRHAARQLGHTQGPPPPDSTPQQEMEHLLRTPQGTAAYAQRGCLIEPVFGDRKANHCSRRFRRRGLTAVQSEWALIHLAGNLRKLHQHTTA